jgi:hypothetical protein
MLGNEHVDRQITAVVTLMKISESKPELDRHYEAFGRDWQQSLPLVLDVDTGEMTKQQ